MTKSFHLTFHALRPAITVARGLSSRFELDLTEHHDDRLGRHWLCDDHVLADRVTVAGFTADVHHDDCPDTRHRSYIAAAFERGRVRDRSARRDYLLRLLTHIDGIELVSQSFSDD